MLMSQGGLLWVSCAPHWMLVGVLTVTLSAPAGGTVNGPRKPGFYLWHSFNQLLLAAAPVRL